VRRRRSLGSAAAGKPCTEGFLEIKLMFVPGVDMLGSSTRVGRSLASRHADRIHLRGGGGVSLGGKEANRDGRNDKIW
jgi:hypothetical protein